MNDRRHFLKMLILFKILLLKALLFGNRIFAKGSDKSFTGQNKNENDTHSSESNGAISPVYKVSGGSPEENMAALISQIGGIDSLIGKKDIVVLKPNAQWWNQGMTNTDAMKQFMELVLDSEDFEGEIIIAENHQYNDYNGRGWSTDQPNGKFNYNQLIEHFNKLGYPNVTSYHWRGAGPNPEPIEGDDDGSGGKRVKGPEDGDGYVWRDDIVYTSPEGNHCWMTYPIFTSKYSGITIDLMNGAWKNGTYLKDRNVKFINFSAINHHGFYCGVTASVKNLMGVVDMSCGFQAPLPEDTYNVHFIGVKKYIKYASKFNRKYLWKFKYHFRAWAYKNFHYTGGALGKFMKDIRMPDLHIITAHWVGWGGRLDDQRNSYPKTLLAGYDPVALDYIAAKYVLLNETPKNETKLRDLNDPDNVSGPFYRFLKECHNQGVGNLLEAKMKVTEIQI